MAKQEEDKKDKKKEPDSNGKVLSKTEKSVDPVDEEEDFPIPPEVLKDLPAEQQERIKAFIRTTFSMYSFSGQIPNPVLQKLTPEHITKVIDNTHISDQRDRDERKDIRGYNLKLVWTGLFVFLALVGFLVIENQIDLLKYLSIALFSFVGGYGLGKSRRTVEDED